MANDLTGNLGAYSNNAPHTIVIEFSQDPDDTFFNEINRHKQD